MGSDCPEATPPTPSATPPKTGTHVGFETNAAACTLLGTGPAMAQNGTADVPVPIAFNTTINSGTTTAFYVTATSGGLF
jgi:hypothetical protein